MPRLYRCNKAEVCEVNYQFCLHKHSHERMRGCDLECEEFADADCTQISSSASTLSEAIDIATHGYTVDRAININLDHATIVGSHHRADPSDVMLDMLEDSGIDPEDIDYESYDNIGVGGDDMPQGTAHERMRFEQMTERQLWTRLGKITTHEKFVNFAAMAREYGHEALAIAAEAKLKVATGETNLSLGNRPRVQPQRANGERLTRKLSI